MRNRFLVSVAFLVSAGVVGAQGANPPISPAAAAPQWRSFLGANPLGIPFDIVSIEAETSISSAATMGVVGSYNDIDHKRYQTLDARFKYFPGEVALQGFAVGLTVGYTKFNGLLKKQPFGTDSARGKLNAPTLGVLVDYNWTQGPTQRFVVGTGVGAKRVLATAEKRDPIGLDRAYLTARFVIGLLF
ncbi:MAG TPA: hypothetical protein VIV65_10805 [Gemmatimonadaceae bacterium]